MNKSNMATAFFIMSFILLLGMSLFLNTVLNTSTSIETYLDQDLEEGMQSIKSTSDGILVTYTWNFEGVYHTVNATYSTATFKTFTDIPMFQIRPYALYVNTSAYGVHSGLDAVVNEISDDLFKIAKNQDFSKEKTANLFLSFVQSLQGTPDPDDHVQFPYETLYEGKGDCEDMAILASRLLAHQDYDVAILQTQDHVGLGLAGKYVGDSFLGDDGVEYFYSETTGAGFVIGELPKTYNFSEVSVFSISPKPFVNIIWSSVIRASEDSYIFNITLVPYGAIPITELSVYLDSNDGARSVLDRKEIFNEVLNTSESTIFSLKQKIPFHTHRFRFITNGNVVSTSWIQPG
jgi:hypothetical protein